MSVRFDFGNRKNPVGTWTDLAWENLKPRFKQVRKADIAEVKTRNQVCGEVDAFWTREINMPLGITTADCVPLLFYRDDGKAIGAVHAGWEGTLLRIVPQFFAALPDDLKNPRDWKVKLGPSIRACCYEFGEDLIARFQAEFPKLDPKIMLPSPRHLDLIAILKHELEALSVQIESIDPECTFCTLDTDGAPRFFSFRRGDRMSRQYSIIVRE
jgi:YfiH family protein